MALKEKYYIESSYDYAEIVANLLGLDRLHVG